MDSNANVLQLIEMRIEIVNQKLLNLKRLKQLISKQQKEDANVTKQKRTHDSLQ